MTEEKLTAAPQVRVVDPRVGPMIEVPPPKPHVVPVPSAGFELVRTAKADVWKVGGAEIDGISVWLIPRFDQRWPHLNPGGVISWLHACVVDRSSFLVRSQNVIALAEARQLPLDPKPVVSEMWLRSRNAPTRKEESIRVRAAIVSWAESIKARSVRLAQDSDVPGDDRIYSIKSDFKQRVVYTLDLGANGTA